MDKNVKDNGSLFGFLSKPSLFQSSSNNNVNRRRSRSRSRSKDSRVSDKFSNINAFEDRSMASASKIQQKGQKFNYQYANTPQNKGMQSKAAFMQTQQNIGKGLTNSFTRQLNIQIPKNPIQNNLTNYQSPSYNDSNQKINSSDNLRMYQSNFPNNFDSSNNKAASFGQNPNTNYPNNFVGHNNNNQLQGPFQILQKATKNADYHSTRFQVSSPKSMIGGLDMRSDRYRQQEDQVSNFNRSVISQQENKVWTDLVSYSSSFQAAKVQSIQCLQNLSVRIGSQISNINLKIQSLNAKMAAALNRQFQQIRRRIVQIVENAFRQKQNFIYDYMNRKQVELAGEMMKVRETLQKESQSIQRMKQRLKTPQWRQAAGQILSSEMEKKIQVIIQKSHQMNLGPWEIGDFGSSHLKNIEKQFKELMNLKNK